jgi:hypothetical protein
MREKDLGRLYARFTDILATHKVAVKWRHSIVSDILFELAVLQDEPKGGDLHERILGLIDKLNANDFRVQDGRLCSVRFVTQDGRTFELNLLQSHLDGRNDLTLDLEMALGVRELHEIGRKVDTNIRFAKKFASGKSIKQITLFDCIKPLKPTQVDISKSKHAEIGSRIDKLKAFLLTLAAAKR